jgi:MtN3 and saliva related transmembrane protein
MEKALWHGIGTLAACLTSFSFIPQIIKVAKNRSSGDLSLVTLLQLSTGVLLWMVYGIYRKDYIIIIANGFTLASLVILLLLYSKYSSKKAI